MNKGLNPRLAKYKFALPDSLSAMISVKRGPLTLHLINLTKVVVRVINPSWVRLCFLMLDRMRPILRNQGIPGLVKFLKVTSILVQQSIAGYKISDVSSIGPRVSRTRGGLPRILPSGIRKEIRLGNTTMIKWVLTILSLFRGLEYITIPKLSTITDPQKGNAASAWSTIIRIRSALDILIPMDKMVSWTSGPRIFPITRSSPNSKSSWGEYSTHPWALSRTAIALSLNHNVLQSMKGLLSWFRSNKIWSYETTIISKMINSIDESSGRSEMRLRKMSNKLFTHVGKLGFKQEPAGKVRVFAMVDPITQWLLSPFHDWIFKVLRRLPMDGTFNQLKPLKRVPEGAPLYSFDLSSATDRLPLLIQEFIVETLFGKVFSQNWVTLMVGRDYYQTRYPPTIVPSTVKYAVGQPMGALSSWGMLALTHHIIVQIAAHRSRKPYLFKEYALLGDDIVIWDKRVAQNYLRIMEGLGVDINLGKSIISPSSLGLEFAKKTLFKGQDVSPVPIREYSAALATSAALVAFVKKYSLPDSVVKRLLGLGSRSSHSKRWEVWTLLTQIPVGHGPTFDMIEKMFQSGSVLIPDFEKLLITRSEALMKKMLDRLRPIKRLHSHDFRDSVNFFSSKLGINMKVFNWFAYVDILNKYLVATESQKLETLVYDLSVALSSLKRRKVLAKLLVLSGLRARYFTVQHATMTFLRVYAEFSALSDSRRVAIHPTALKFNPFKREESRILTAWERWRRFLPLFMSASKDVPSTGNPHNRDGSHTSTVK